MAASKYERMSFPSSGDPEKDAAEAAAIRRRYAQMDEGLCPNECGPLTIDSEHERHCAECSFVHVGGPFK